MSKIIDYLKDTKTELKHVVWPKKSLTTLYTLVIIIFSVFVAYFLGFFDYIFGQGLQQLLTF